VQRLWNQPSQTTMVQCSATQARFSPGAVRAPEFSATSWGAKQLEVAQHIAGSSGLDLGSVAKLLPMLAPMVMVMGYLGRKQRADGLDAGGLAEMLGGEKKSLEGAGPGLGGLSKILGGDGDGDGDMMDDIKGMAGGLLGKLSGRK
jgi:hypothetical protein